MYDWELQSAADALEETMPDLCDIFRRSGTDEYGGGGEINAPLYEGVAVSVTPIPVNPFSETTFGAQRETGLQYYELLLPRGTDIRAGDVAIVRTLTSNSDFELTVRQVEAFESWDLAIKAQATVAS